LSLLGFTVGSAQCRLKKPANLLIIILQMPVETQPNGNGSFVRPKQRYDTCSTVSPTRRAPLGTRL
jgi:hypothetical protein